MTWSLLTVLGWTRARRRAPPLCVCSVLMRRRHADLQT
ncbi:hypothetical protein ABUH87_13280 [Novosphingobium sp. M1R2S20]|uniref:Uncharacterized protein n=1 Tax=Novosphingobium rhizovicinum TaxID=3228928 RepID=A0ABV3RE40_9SPHN